MEGNGEIIEINIRIEMKKGMREIKRKQRGNGKLRQVTGTDYKKESEEGSERGRMGMRKKEDREDIKICDVKGE